MTARPRAYITRECPGQVRFKLPDKRRDGAFFRRAEACLSKCPQVTEIRTNPLTGSILVHHHGSIGAVADHARSAGLFDLADRPHRVPPRQAPGDQLDIPSLFIALYIGLGLLQVARGQILSPATTLLWIAAQMLQARAASRAAASVPAED